MHSTSTTKADRFTAIAKVGGTCITISIWCFVGVWVYKQATSFKQRPTPQQIEDRSARWEVEKNEFSNVESPTQKATTEIEQFRPQLNTSTWGEVEEIINSFKAEMRQCESYEDENKIACYDHYKTQFWRKMDSEVKTRN